MDATLKLTAKLTGFKTERDINEFVDALVPDLRIGLMKGEHIFILSKDIHIERTVSDESI